MTDTPDLDIEEGASKPNGAEASPIADATELSEEELELRNLRIDIPGGGSTGAGLTSISIAKTPPREQFFRTHPTHVLELHMIESSQGTDVAFLAVLPKMVQPLIAISFRPNPYRLFLTITRDGVLRYVPVRLPGDGEWNAWHESKQQVLVEAREAWVRMTAGDGRYDRYLLEPGVFPDPSWPEISMPRLIRLAFRDRGRLIDSTEHPYFQKLIGRAGQ